MVQLGVSCQVGVTVDLLGHGRVVQVIVVVKHLGFVDTAHGIEFVFTFSFGIGSALLQIPRPYPAHVKKSDQDNDQSKQGH